MSNGDVQRRIKRLGVGIKLCARRRGRGAVLIVVTVVIAGVCRLWCMQSDVRVDDAVVYDSQNTELEGKCIDANLLPVVRCINVGPSPSLYRSIWALMGLDRVGD